MSTQTSKRAGVRFRRRFLDYLQSLAQGEWFSISFGVGEGSELNLRVALAGPEVGHSMGLEDDLFDLFSDRDSSIVVPRDVIAVGKSLKKPGIRHSRAWQLRPRSFTDASGTRQVATALEFRENGLGEMVAALLKSGDCAVSFFVQPSPSGVEVLRSLLNDRFSRSPRAEQIANKVASDGLPFDAQVIVTSPGALPRSLAASLLGLAPGTELISLDATPEEIWESSRTRLPLRIQGSTPTFTGFGMEVAALVRFPSTDRSTFPGADVIPSQLVRAGHNVPREQDPEQIRLGSVIDQTGQLSSARIGDLDLDRHLYVPGQTGSGKSTFMRGLAVELARRGQGFLFIDPHGNTVERLLGELPRERMDDVTFIDTADLRAPAPINPFAVSDPLQQDTALENVIDMFVDLFDPHKTGIIGPRWETWFRMGMLTLIAADGINASILDVPNLFLDKEYLAVRRRALTNPIVIDFWDKEMEQTSEKDKSEMLGWFNSKFSAFRINSVLRSVLGSGADVLDPSRVMDSSKIVLVSLAKGEIGEPVTRLLGYVYLTRFWTAALRRRSPRPFSVFVDEAQSFTKGSLPAMLSEGRKFGLRVIMANQYLGQIPEDLRGSILGNVGNVVALRLGSEDAENFGSRFTPEFDARALRMMPNFRAAASILANGTVVPSFSLLVDHEARLDPSRVQKRQAGEIQRKSQAYLKEVARATVAEANARRAAIATQVEEEREKRTSPSRAAHGPRNSTPKADATGSSFLDEWLEKRRALEVATTASVSTATQDAPSAPDANASRGKSKSSSSDS